MNNKSHITFLFGAGAEKCLGLPLGKTFEDETMNNTKGFFQSDAGKALKELLKNSIDFIAAKDNKTEKYTSDTLAGFNLSQKNKMLDRFFHTLINPSRFGYRNFSVIINYYWICYFSIIRAIFFSNCINTEQNLKKLEKYKNNNEPDYEKILQNIESFTKYLYSLDIDSILTSTENYYIEIKNQFIDSGFCKPYVITTNYFNFAETLSKEVAYANGQLKYFEYPSLLEVRDFLKEEKPDDKKRVFFPFIFGQSYVKPIVNYRQIEEFQKVKKYLDESQILIVIGYAINEDDNHLNSYIHQFLNNVNNRLYYLTDENETTVKNQLLDKLKIQDTQRIIVIKKNYSRDKPKEIINCIYSEINKLHPAQSSGAK